MNEMSGIVNITSDAMTKITMNIDSADDLIEALQSLGSGIGGLINIFLKSEHDLSQSEQLNILMGLVVYPALDVLGDDETDLFLDSIKKTRAATRVNK